MKNSRLFLVVICIALMIFFLVFLIKKIGQRDELNFVCEYHKDFYRNQIAGFVIEHYVDSTDHARRTVKIKDEYGRKYEVWFIPYDNWADFDKIKVNDVISKRPNSFAFSVNNEFNFVLKLECNYP